ncbi:MAG: ABC transporter permease [Firmicutes bacterium]|nr:ABC transporter permease [Bacillota bacterium]
MKKLKFFGSTIKSLWVRVVKFIVRYAIKIYHWILRKTNIIRRELRANLKSFLIWTISLTGIAYVASMEFVAFRDSPNLMESMQSFVALFEALGLQITNLSTPEGFLSFESIYFYIPLGIYAALLGSSLISKEERDKTAEYLFTLPVTRTKVLVSKVIVGVFYNIVINVIIMAGAMLTYVRFSPEQVFYEFIGYLSIGVIVTQLIFMSVGMLMASVLKQYKKSGAATLGYVMGSYLLFVLIGFIDQLDFLKYIIPFKYFEASDMLTGTFHLEYIIISVVIVISGITGLFYFYRRRDLYI